MRRNDYLERILKARVYDVALETPLEPARALSERLQNRLLIKREDLQPVFSFKLRGAYNKMASLPRSRLARGVIAASAGNHAQGVALAAQRLRCRATIVMPVTTPRIKVDAARAPGAGRAVCRRGGGEGSRARDVPALPRAGGRDGARRHRRDVRGDQGRLRGHARGARAGRRPGGGGREGLGRAPWRARQD